MKRVRAVVAGKVVSEIIQRQAPTRQPCFCFLRRDQIIFVTKSFRPTGNGGLIQIQL
jgi:hypothetical protein